MNNECGMYVTPEFIRDARCADYTLWIFGGGFNSPNKDLSQFNQTWKNCSGGGGTLSVKYWLNGNISQPGTDTGLTLYGLTTCLSEDMTKATVKIYIDNNQIYRQNFGYLTYSINGYGEQSESKNECIAFYFRRCDYIQDLPTDPSGLKQSGLNDAAYITIDLSALNIAANIKPVYNKACDISVGGGFIYDHQHILTEPNDNTLNTSEVYADAGCMSNLYYAAEKERSVVVERTNRNSGIFTECNFYVAADGRFVNNMHASDYGNAVSCVCIGEPTKCGLAAQKCMANCICYSDVIYFEDLTPPVENEGGNNGGN